MKNIISRNNLADQSTSPSQRTDIPQSQLLAEEALRNYAVGSHFVALAVLFALFEIFFTQGNDYSAFRWWAAALGSICLVEIAIKFMMKNHRTSGGKPLKIRLLAASCFVFGVISTASVYFLFPNLGSDGKILLAIVCFALSISAAITRHTIWPSSLGAIGAGLPLAAILVLTGDDRSIFWLGPLSLVVWLCVIGLSWLLHNSFRNRTELSSQKELLLQNIEAKMRELDELRKLELNSRKEAETANRSKSRFLAHVSHDLRQPLHALNLLVETIPENSATPATQDIISRIRDSLDMLTELFDSLLDLALLNTGKVEVNLASVPLETLFHLIKQEFEPMANTQGMEIRYAPTSLSVQTDHIILRRMVQNLVSNAIKHAHGDTVLIGARKKSGKIAIEVRDNGRGISPADQSQIFEEFTRQPAKGSEALPQGLGLGLAIVQRLGGVLGLQIELRSKLKEGSLFRITGLDYAPHKSDDATVFSQHKKHDVSGSRALVVDDDAEILAATKALLEKWGYDVVTQSSAEFDIESTPHIMICDFELPEGKTGMDVIARVRRRFNASIPALIITGNSSSTVLNATQQHGVPVLRKPIRPAQLRSAILTVLSSPNPQSCQSSEKQADRNIEVKERR